MTDDFPAADAHIAALEDASGIVELIESRLPSWTPECAGCGGSGSATTWDGRDLGICDQCDGSGACTPTEGENQ